MTVAAEPTPVTRPAGFPWSWCLPALLVIAVTGVTGALRYDAMPDRLVLHYAANGVPDVAAHRTLVTAFGPVLAQVVLTALLLVLAWGVRMRGEPDVTGRARVGGWLGWAGLTARALLFLAAFGDLSLFFVASQLWQPRGSATGPVLSTVLATAVGVAGVVGLFVYARQSGYRAAAAARIPTRIRGFEDGNWRGGMLYVNREDPAMLVPKRSGLGWTLNFGHPIAWVTLAVALAIPAVTSILLPLSG